ncbi:MAG: hypothetical protein HND48_06265 [Chloroflexi bacterium]|nr:hypothetical protein [Chloroflexota bacterium]
MEEAERTANAFLFAWQSSDYGTMHSLISFSTRDATPLDQFSAIYENAADTMSLTALAIRPAGDCARREHAARRCDGLRRDVHDRLAGGHSPIPNGRLDARIRGSRAYMARRMVAGDVFREMEQGAQLRLLTTTVNRANIYDRSGIVLAMQDDRLIVTVNVVRRSIRDEAGCISTLASAANVEQDVIARRLIPHHLTGSTRSRRSSRPPIPNTRRRSSSSAATFGNRPARRYPNGSLMPHPRQRGLRRSRRRAGDRPRGASRRDSILGRSGIERSWDEVLRGRPRVELVLDMPNGTRLRSLGVRPSQEAQAVWLTIDTGLQARVLEILSTAYAQNADTWGRQSKGAAAIVIDVRTGEILAMVQLPHL